MREIEIKVLEVNHEDFEDRIFELGGEKVSDLELLTVKYDRDDNSVSKADRGLRLRKKGDSVMFTYKSTVEDNDRGLKIREEINVEVSDLDDMRNILGNIGFEEVRVLKKRRIKYIIDNVEVVFDTYLGEYSYIPEFLEIEAPS